jgi:hypothetical protein
MNPLILSVMQHRQNPSDSGLKNIITHFQCNSYLFSMNIIASLQGLNINTAKFV